MSAYGRRWTSCVSVPWLSIRVIPPIGSPRDTATAGASVGSVPRVTTWSPAFSSALGVVKLQDEVVRVAGARRLDDAERRRAARRARGRLSSCR